MTRARIVFAILGAALLGALSATVVWYLLAKSLIANERTDAAANRTSIAVNSLRELRSNNSDFAIQSLEAELDSAIVELSVSRQSAFSEMRSESSFSSRALRSAKEYRAAYPSSAASNLQAAEAAAILAGVEAEKKPK